MHLDLKPTNVLTTSKHLTYDQADPMIKICDLGLSQYRDDGSSAIFKYHTGTYETLGPESINVADETIIDGKKMDVWALVCGHEK